MNTLLLQKTKGIIQILRPELPFAAGACVVLGQVVALGGFPTLLDMTVGFLCGFFISGSAIVLNDFFDLEVDKVNSPSRPIPAGIVSPGEAIWLTVITAALGLAVAYFLGTAAFVLCIIFWIIGCLYNWKFKEAGLLGNLMVSSSVGITFILGGMSVGQPWNGIVRTFALMAFLIDLGEEIAGDAMDMEGDKERNSRSIAILRGRGFALTLSSILFSLVVVVSFLPFIFGWMGTTYLVMILPTDILIAFFTVRLVRSKTSEQGRQAMRGIYLGALIGVMAAILGQLFQ